VLETRFTRLVGCTVPIQLAGMGGVSVPALVAAVTAAGGLGMLGAAPASMPDRIDVLDAMGCSLRGANFLGPFLNPEEFEATIERVRLAEVFWREPDPALVEQIHAAGALAGWQVGSVDDARAAADAGCDIVVAQGVEAGGHVQGQIGLLPLLGAVVDAVGDDVVVVAAGGIGSARAMAAALAAGAQAVRIGTRFVASAESGAHPDYKAALVAAGADETVLSEEFGRTTGWPDAPNRVLRAALDEASAFDGDVVAQLHLPGSDASFPVARFDTLPPLAECEGNVSAMAQYAGQSVGDVRAVQPAAEIVRELAEGAEALLSAAR
jgi:NAD(P)H-dependent flavin oxidoreductase YrpB (nitropropane dioxygenase family)